MIPFFRPLSKLFKFRLNRSGKEKVLSRDYCCPLPSKFYIESGNICNLRCPFCGTGLRRKGFARGFMSKEHFAIILKKIASYTDHISLYNYGEPFLNSDFLAMVSLAAEYGVKCSTHSNLNAYAFDDTSSAAVISSGLLFLSASIDGASQETYGKYRVGGSFELAIRNLERLRQAKERLGSATPHLVWKFLINKFNEDEQEKAKEIAASIGVPIEFHLMDVWGNEEWKSSQHKEQEVWGAEKDQSHVTGSEEEWHKIRDLPVTMDNLKLHPKLHYWCEQPFDAMVINWNGEVFPCVTACDDKFSLGNLLGSDLETLWNNSKYRACRKFLYNFGPTQNSDAVCAALNCELKQKYLDTV